jgi:hypothetical protein
MLPAVFRSESAALGFITSRVAKGTEIVADEAGGWNDLLGRYAMQRIDHQAAYSDRGVYSNGAESLFSRMRRAEIGHHHHVAGAYLVRYAQAPAWREDHRRVDNGRQVQCDGVGDGGQAVRGLVRVLAAGATLNPLARHPI